jgi:hydrophobic/amphiphilic exporter-1 (mainly G- bacteria), HAE1 family
MKIIQDAVRFPVTTAVGVLFLALFGLLALFSLPVQLTPDVTQPQVSVSTFWPGASPREIEREIIDRQEEQLKSLDGLVRLQSSSSASSGSIVLTFQVGVDLDSARVRVANALEQVRRYPEDALKPVIRTVDLTANAIAWFSLEHLPGHGDGEDIGTLLDFAEDLIKPAFERVPGVAAANVFGGRARELHVIVDPANLAARRVTLNQLGAALDRETRDFSGGDFDEGKRRYTVRTIGEYQTPEDVENVVIAVRDGVPIYVRDVGHAELGYRKATARVFSMGQQVLAVNAIKEPGENVLEVMAQIQEAASSLNADQLARRGLRLVQMYDETEYVRSAVGLVKNSLTLGAFLAIGVLLLFLRSGSSTLVIAVAIPISAIGTFLMMSWLGRSINVISLAGLAFAVGMAVDNSIVVLENIYRHRQMGKRRAAAAVDGAREVWGAVLASTLTTIAVFVPIAFIQEEAGQLFGDIAIAISCAVALSLLVSITVIPSLSARILRVVEPDSPGRGYHDVWGLVGLAQRLSRRLVQAVSWMLDSVVRRVAVAATLVILALGLSWLLMPKTEYLPLGNNNFLFGLLLPPPGYNLEELSAVHEVFERELSPFWQHEPGSLEALKQPGGGIRGYFFVVFGNMAFTGVRANEPLRVRELIPQVMGLNGKMPGAIMVVNQPSIFQTGRGEGRNIDIVLSGPDLDRLIGLGTRVFGDVMQKIPGAQARPIPGLDLGNPEVHVVTDRRRAAEAGISNRDLGFTVSALIDGARASDFRLDGRELDLKVVAPGGSPRQTHVLEQMPIATPDGRLITLGSVAAVVQTSGPIQIDHRERQRAITIQVTPSEQMPLEAAMDLIGEEIVAPLRASGDLAPIERVTLSGSADKLTQTFRVLRFDLLLALVITYLLMAALFESFLHPLVIMFSVPLAALGGFLGLATLNLFTYQALDVLTMFGFIILIGTVVNNAILIVHQSLNHMREEGMAPREAIAASVGNRIRPIFMTVTTTVCAMMPLVLFPGAGSELYRGLGSVVIGGLVVSTVFTLFLVPALFSLVLDLRAVVARRVPAVARVAPETKSPASMVNE